MPLDMPFSPRSRRRPQTTSVWGDGLIDQSLTTLWYPRDWSDVGEDELVFFIPSLGAGHRRASDEAGPALHIRRALARRLNSAVRLLSTGDDQQTLERIAACGVVSACKPQASAEVSCSLQGYNHYGSQRQPNDLAVWTFELSVLVCIDRMLLDAMPHRPRHAECYIASADCAEVLVASIHTCINGAYVYPEFAFAHELLGAGAWLGLLLRGRSALMPEFVAEVLIDYIAHFKNSWEDAQDPIVRLFNFHAELAGGAERLLRRARKVRRTGNPALVSGADCRPPQAPPDPMSAMSFFHEGLQNSSSIQT